MLAEPAVCAVLHDPATSGRNSGMLPLVASVGGEPVWYRLGWERLQRRSWTLGCLLRRLGNRFYGSEWNALVPWLDESRLAREAAQTRADVIHFLWAEFASPRRPAAFRRGGAKLVGTFHCSARRQPSVLGRYRCMGSFDGITAMSQTQVPFLVEKGAPADRTRVILHGVNETFFSPGGEQSPGGDRLRALLVGYTERDHEFAAEVFRRARGIADADVFTATDYHGFYKGIGNVRLREWSADEHLRDAYRQADVLVMPMLDCTANNAILESMACGTPVMVNRVGGVPEYVDSSCNFVMDGKNADEWVDLLTDLARNRDALAARRPAVRAWAERFSWSLIAPQYLEFYRQVLSV